MNKDNAKDYLPLVQALAEGKTLQYMYLTGKWADVQRNVDFTSDASHYRIKPEPKKFWVIFSKQTGALIGSSDQDYVVEYHKKNSHDYVVEEYTRHET